MISRRSAAEAVDHTLTCWAEDDLAAVWIDRLTPAQLRARAATVDGRVAAGADLPLAGTTLAVKGNIDVAGLRTTAGCPSYGSVAVRSAAAVRSLEAAGAVVVGTTNLDQFATGLTGRSSPHGAPVNPRWSHLLTGGSSSGSAVAVAAGQVDLALGTDTAGSGRVPAAFHGLVGLKPTRGRISAAGVVPACQSLDCVSIFAENVDLAALAAELATGPDADDPWSRRLPESAISSPPTRIAVPDPATLDFDGDPDAGGRFAGAVGALLTGTPMQAVPVDLRPFLAVGRLLYDGAFVAERYAAVGAFLDTDPVGVDPLVSALIRAAGDVPAWRLAADITELKRLQHNTLHVWEEADVLVVPTVPRLLTVTQAAADVRAASARLGTYTNFVNLLDLCALTVPVPPELGVPADPAGPPTSITLIGPAGTDDRLVSVARSLGTPASPRTR